MRRRRASGVYQPPSSPTRLIAAEDRIPDVFSFSGTRHRAFRNSPFIEIAILINLQR